MAVTVAEGEVLLTANTSRFGRDVSTGVMRGGREAESAVQSSGSGLGSKLVKGMGLVAAAGVGAVVTTAGVALTKGFSRALNIQDATAKLSGLGHSAKAVSGIMDDALASVRGTAFGLDSAATVAAGAVAAGIKPGQELQKVLKLTADAATITGGSMSDMGSIFNKVAASGKLQGDVIAQLQDAGVPVLQFVAKQIGKTAAETSKMASAGKIDFATFEAAMSAGLGGAALKSGNTARGAWANVGAALGRLGAQFASPLVANSPALFNNITKALDALGTKMKPITTDFANGLAKVAPAAKLVSDILFKGDFKKNPFGIEEDSSVVNTLFTIRDTAISVFASIKSGAQSFFGALQPFFKPIMDALGPIIPAFVKLWGAVSPLQIVFKALAPVLPIIGNLLGKIGLALSTSLGTIIPVLVPALVKLSTALSTALGSAIQQILPQLEPLVQSMLDLLPPITDLIVTLLPPLTDLLVSLLQPTSDGSSAMSGFGDVLKVVVGVIGFVLKSVGGLITGVSTLIKVFTGAMTPTQVLSDSLKGKLGPVFQFISRTVLTMGYAVRDSATRAGNAISSFVQASAAKLSAIITAFNTMKTRVINTLNALPGTLVNIGVNIVEGLARGVRNGWGRVTSTIHSLAMSLPKVVRDALGIKSPSRVFMQLGRYVVQGFALGITGTTSQIKSAMQTLANKTVDAYNTISKDKKHAITKAQSDFIGQVIGANSGYMQTLSKQQDSVVSRLKSANKNLADLLKQAATYKSGILSSLTKIDPTTSQNAADFTQNLTDQVAQTKLLTKTLAALRKRGLDDTTYQSLVAKGTDALPIAQSILDSGRGGIKQIATLQSQLTKSSGALAQQATHDMYGAGVASAKGLIKGLESQKSALAKSMKSLANDMVSAIKAELGIHSPSRVMHDEVGVMMGRGISSGLATQMPSIRRGVVQGLALATTGSGAQAAQSNPGAFTKTNNYYTTINESTDPLGTEGRLASAYRKWGKQ